jgi:Septum formation initiator
VSRLLRGRVLFVAVLALVTFLYYRPLTSYVATKGDLDRRRVEVAELRAEREQLERRLVRSTSVASLRREARRIGYVRPGERLFIVTGIPEWRRAKEARSTLRDDD